MKHACIIILNYNNYEDTIECVKSVQKIDYPSYEIVIVDNASTNNSIGELRNSLGDAVTYIETGENLGYAGGNNVGLKYALEKDFQYMCILNNDTIVKSDFLTKCTEFLDENEDVSFVGPIVLEFNDDIVQSTGGNLIIQKGGIMPLNHGKKVCEIPDVIESDYISGACLVFKTSFLREHGLIPENYFLFYEETEWCYQAKKKGYRNVCIKDTYIRHKGSVSINKTEGLSAYMMARNRVVFVKRNIGDKGKYIKFIIYLIAQTIYSALKNDLTRFKLFVPYFDGVTNRVSKKYPFVKINNE